MNDVQITNHVFQNKSFPISKTGIHSAVRGENRWQANVNKALCWCAMSRGGHLNLMEDLGTVSFQGYKRRFPTADDIGCFKSTAK